MIAALLIALVAAQPPAAAAPALLQPTGAWRVDQSPGGCVLQRSFGSASDPVEIGFGAHPVDRGARVIVVRSNSAQPSFPNSKITVQFATGDAPLSVKGWAPMLAGDRETRASFSLDGAAMARVAAARRISIEMPGSRVVALDLVHADAALAALERCRIELVKSWGMSEDELARIVTPPVASPSIPSLFAHIDYPASAIASGAHGMVRARMDIDAAGRVQNCVVIESSHHLDLDQLACTVTRRSAHYQPARDAAGHDVRSFAVEEISFWLSKG